MGVTVQGLNSLQVMDKIIAGCTERGIKVILDYHRIHATVNNEDGLWWDKEYPRNMGQQLGHAGQALQGEPHHHRGEYSTVYGYEQNLGHSVLVVAWVGNWVMLAKRYKRTTPMRGALYCTVLYCTVRLWCRLTCSTRCTAARSAPGAPFWVHHAGPYEAEFNFRTWSYRLALSHAVIALYCTVLYCTVL